MRVAAMVLFLASGVHAADACGVSEGWTPMSADGGSGYTVAIRMPSDFVPVSRPFDLDLRVCGGDLVATPSVSATMPAHRHGMNYRPTISSASESDFEVGGMVFHMPGRWRIEVETRASGGPQRFHLDVEAR